MIDGIHPFRKSETARAFSRDFPWLFQLPLNLLARANARAAPGINLDPFVRPRRAVRSIIRRDSAERWPAKPARERPVRVVYTFRPRLAVFGYITCRVRDDGYVCPG